VAITGSPLPWIHRDSRKGLYYTQQWRGLNVVRSWPRHRKARRSALQRQKETDFANAVLAIKWLDPTIVSQVQDAFAKGPALWRDYLMSLLYGTAFALTTEEGATIYPRQFHEKVSRALDLLGAETGALLVRADAQWQTLPPGAAGMVLTSRGPALTPAWQ